MRNTLILYIAFLFTLLAACGDPSSPAVRVSGPITPEESKVLFTQKCATCHGTSGNLGIGGAKKLTESQLSKEKIAAQIRYGKGAMPPFGETLTAEEIDALAIFSKELQPIQQH